MFGLRRPSRKTNQNGASGPRQARPRLEGLESRCNPSTLSLNVSYGLGRSITLSGTLGEHSNPSMQMINITGQASGMTTTNPQGQFSVTLTAAALGNVSATAADGTSNTPSVTLTDVAISLTFDASEGSNNQWTLSGDVTYSRGPTCLNVYFGGAPATLTIHSTTTNSTGHYSLIVTLSGTSSDNGTASAKAVSPWGTESELALDYVHQTGT